MAELRGDEFGMNYHPIYFSHPKNGIHMCYLKKFNLMGWNFVLQGDEKQGMILIQDEGMDFQPS